jgi:hypothetical protein
MRRLGRRALILIPVISSALVLGVVPAASEAALTSSTLSCNDGTNLNLTLSTAQLTDLTNAVSAMALYPAGLSCGVSSPFSS